MPNVNEFESKALILSVLRAITASAVITLIGVHITLQFSLDRLQNKVSKQGEISECLIFYVNNIFHYFNCLHASINFYNANSLLIDSIKKDFFQFIHCVTQKSYKEDLSVCRL